MKEHVCKESTTCTCYMLADEPSEDCPQHGGGTFPPRCELCGKFMKWGDSLEDVMLLAITRYKLAHEAAGKCTDMILSSGRTEEAAKLMQELEDAREALFAFSNEKE